MDKFNNLYMRVNVELWYSIRDYVTASQWVSTHVAKIGRDFDSRPRWRRFSPANHPVEEIDFR